MYTLFRAMFQLFFLSFFIFPSIVQASQVSLLSQCAINGICYYNNPDCWKNKILPGSGDDVSIGSTTSLLTVVLESSTVLVKSLTVSNTVTFIISNASLQTTTFSWNRELNIINGSNVNCTQSFTGKNVYISGSNLTTNQATIVSGTVSESNLSSLSLRSSFLSFHNSYLFCQTLAPTNFSATGERTKIEVNNFVASNATLENISDFTCSSASVKDYFFITSCNYVVIKQMSSSFGTTIILRGKTYLEVHLIYYVSWIFDGSITLYVRVMANFEKIRQTPYSTVSIIGDGYISFNKETTLHGNFIFRNYNKTWPTLTINAPLSIYNDHSCILGSSTTFLYAPLFCNSKISVYGMSFENPGVNVSAKNIVISNYLRTVSGTTINGNINVDEHLQLFGNTIINGNFMVKSSLRIYPTVNLSQSVITATGDISLIDVETSLDFYFDTDYENGKKIILAETVNGKIHADIASISNRKGTRLTHYQRDKKLFVLKQDITKYFIIMAIVSVSLVFGMLLYYYAVWRRFLSNISTRLSQLGVEPGVEL